MANTLGIVHPGLLAGLATNFYPSVCTIQQATMTQDAAGQETLTWANLSGHVGLVCVFGVAKGSGREARTDQQTYVTVQRRIILPGVYTAITESMAALVDGVRYNILSVFFDSRTVQTYLDVEQVT